MPDDLDAAVRLRAFDFLTEQRRRSRDAAQYGSAPATPHGLTD